MVSHISTLEVEIVKLKEDNEKSGQKKTDDDMSTSLTKVCTYMLMDTYNYIWFY